MCVRASAASAHQKCQTQRHRLSSPTSSARAQPTQGRPIGELASAGWPVEHALLEVARRDIESTAVLCRARVPGAFLRGERSDVALEPLVVTACSNVPWPPHIYETALCCVDFFFFELELRKRATVGATPARAEAHHDRFQQTLRVLVDSSCGPNICIRRRKRVPAVVSKRTFNSVFIQFRIDHSQPLHGVAWWLMVGGATRRAVVRC